MVNDNLLDPVSIIKDVIDHQFFAVLSSVEKGHPYSNLVAFAATDDLKYLVFVTNRYTRKYRNITENHRVSLLMDNRTNQTTDINKAIAITVLGTAQEETYKRRGFHCIFLTRHPHLSDFIESPESVIIVVTVSEYIIAGFSKTQRLVITS